MAVSVDAQILIWGVKGQATPNRVDMIVRAAHFFAQCRSGKTRIIVPAQALAEYLVGFDDESLQESLRLISEGFIIAPLDAKAAAIAGELQRDWDELKGIISDFKEYGATKQTVKADINVIASSIASEATTLYTDEAEKFRRIAKGRILIKRLPELPARQTSIIAEADDGF
ncbi:MAG: hypothetical protein DCC68_25625 [Planctomycetota bacterium]|nr:MAG: hypothetical protein DCC68_25625 [Planctomycetota bacterium]